jgi:hypothetical protein
MEEYVKFTKKELNFRQHYIAREKNGLLIKKKERGLIPVGEQAARSDRLVQVRKEDGEADVTFRLVGGLVSVELNPEIDTVPPGYLHVFFTAVNNPYRLYKEFKINTKELLRPRMSINLVITPSEELFSIFVTPIFQTYRLQ